GGGPGELNGLADRSVPWVAVRREDYLRVEVLQDAERGKGLGRVAVEPGGLYLRADPAGQRIVGDQGVAGEQGSPGFEEQHGVAWCVPGVVQCAGFAWDVENIVVGEGGHLRNWDDLCALVAGERDHRSVELRARQIPGQAGVPLSWLGPPGYCFVVLVDPYARGPFAARSLGKADMVR